MWLKIIWQTGATSEHHVQRRVHTYRDYIDLERLRQRITELNGARKMDGEIAAIDRIGRDALLRCGRAAGGRQWLVRITPSAVASLGLVSGRAVWLAIKSHSFRVL